jgi:flagellar biosynthesis protein FlhG
MFMPDQAAGLRSLFARRRPSLLIVAGSDAAKAAVAVHFAREAAAAGRATLLVDGTPGQVATTCDLACRYELSHVVAGDKTIEDVVRRLTPHLVLLPAARALSRFGSFLEEEEARLADAFSNGIAHAFEGPDTQIDLIVVNAEEAQAMRALEAFGRDARIVIVASEHGASLRGAYVEMKALSQYEGLGNFEIVAPCFGDAVASGIAFTNLAATARRFLEIELVDGGSVTLPAPGGTGVIQAAAAENTRFASTSTQAPTSLSTSEEEASHAAAIA